MKCKTVGKLKIPVVGLGTWGIGGFMEAEIIPYCQENNIIIMAYRPLERGFLLNPHPVLDELSKKYERTKAQIAINWLISKENVITIPKSTNIEHLKENSDAVGWSMSGEDIRSLDEMEF